MKEHPVLFSVLITIISGGILALLVVLFAAWYNPSDFLQTFLFLWFIFGTFLVYPFVLTFINFFMMLKRPVEEKMIRAEKWFEFITVILGSVYSLLFSSIFVHIDFTADWTETLYNLEQHTPIWTESYPTVIAVAFVGIIGYLILSWIPLKKMPPLVIVSAMAAMYLGTGECILWMIQIQGESDFLMILPFNCIVITIKTIRRKVGEWNEMEGHAVNYDETSSFLKTLNGKLENAKNWPLAALILMLPLLGIMICILVLFGQRPDAVIKAWTETAGWSLSQRVAPQNIRYDEHYLCTVAAGGHRKVVKPIRMGVRHGHRVTVNRQLCIPMPLSRYWKNGRHGFTDM